MSAKDTVNTRIEKRYKTAGRLQIEMLSIGLNVKVKVELLDVNKFGGIGFFLPRDCGISKVPLSSFLAGWKLSRQTKKGKIDFTVKFTNAVPMVIETISGIRVSALPVSASSKNNSEKFFISTRRASNRTSKGKRSVLLYRKGIRISGNVLNVGDDDGIGIEINAPDLTLINWGDVFLNDWMLNIEENKVPCIPQRIGLNNGAVVLGIIAPGVKRLMNGESSSIEDLNSNKTNSLGDDILLKILDTAMKDSKKRKL